MKIIYSAIGLKSFRENDTLNVAFIPTMGALHDGHLHLVKTAKSKGQFTVVSIFINPLQFNNKEDLLKYPKSIADDLKKLSEIETDLVFIPDFESIYPSNNFNEIQLPQTVLENVFEGKHRPGHFNGVVQVLNSLFNLVKPKYVYFGQKDLQQCMVVKKLIEFKFSEIEFNMVETIREISGLAMSSRNVRLNEKSLNFASEIFKSLTRIKQLKSISRIDCENEILRLKNYEISTEYLSIVSLPNFEETFEEKNAGAVVFAGVIDGVRLIDNLLL